MPRLPLALLALLFACGKDPAPAPVEEASDGPVSGATPRATLDRVKVSTDLSAIRTAIDLYKASNEDALPPDLGSLSVSGLYYPDAYSYDAASGTVSCPELPGL